MTLVFVVSHNNAREGAPRLCAKLASGLRETGWFESVSLLAFASLAVAPRMRFVSSSVSYITGGGGTKLYLILTALEEVALAGVEET